VLMISYAKVDYDATNNVFYNHPFNNNIVEANSADNVFFTAATATTFTSFVHVTTAVVGMYLMTSGRPSQPSLYVLPSKPSTFQQQQPLPSSAYSHLLLHTMCYSRCRRQQPLILTIWNPSHIPIKVFLSMLIKYQKSVVFFLTICRCYL